MWNSGLTMFLSWTSPNLTRILLLGGLNLQNVWWQRTNAKCGPLHCTQKYMAKLLLKCVGMSPADTSRELKELRREADNSPSLNCILQSVELYLQDPYTPEQIDHSRIPSRRTKKWDKTGKTQPRGNHGYTTAPRDSCQQFKIMRRKRSEKLTAFISKTKCMTLVRAAREPRRWFGAVLRHWEHRNNPLIFTTVFGVKIKTSLIGRIVGTKLSFNTESVYIKYFNFFC